MGANEIIDTFFTKVLLEDMEQNLFFSNVSLDDKELKLIVRIDRNQRLLKDIDKNKTILLQGYIIKYESNPVFIINRILMQGNYPKKRFEIARKTTVYFRSEDVYNEERDRNILTQEFISKLPPLSKIAKNRLKDWEDFLNWQRKYINKNMIGFKYLSYENDEDKEKIIFEILVDKVNEKKLEKLAKFGELAVYPNEISSKTYSFDYNDNKKFIKMIQLGDFEESFSKNITNHDEFDLIKDEISEPIVLFMSFSLRDSENELIDVKHIYESGFLAINNIGNLIQIKRQQKALKEVIRGNIYNPFLSSWLFNIKNADLPKNDKLDIEFFNKNLNEDQKRAVKKMLLAPNIGLLQGPPGTGKTTVIAEIIQQFVKDNKKVLLSSQSNLAVDNALDRLSDSNEIRAIRLGRANKVSQDAKKFLEENIVDSFYKKIANNLQKRFLLKKEEVKKQLNDLKKYKNDIKILKEKENKYNEDLISLKEKEQELLDLYKMEKNRIDSIKNNNKELEIKQKGFNRLIDVLKNNKEESNFYIKDFNFLKNIYDEIKILENSGISLYIDELIGDVSLDKKNKIFREFIKKILQFSSLKENILNDINNNISDSYEIEQLKKELISINDKLDEIDEESEEFRKLLKKRKELKNMIKNSNKSFLDKKIYQKVLSTDFYEKIKSESLSMQKEKLKKIATLNIDIKTKLIKIIESEARKINLTKIDDSQVKRYETQINTIREDIKNKNQSLKKIRLEINNIYSSIYEKYKINSDEIDDNIALLEEHLQNDLSEKLVNFIDHFYKIINSHELDENERENILEKYIKNSNVVALTLNENIKLLESKNFTMFDIVIIDEVSKATPPELLNIMSLGKKVILVGDHRQLPPVWGYNEEKGFKDHINDDNELTKENYSKFEKMVNASIFKEYFEQADNSIKESLLTQYRMHTQIMNIVNCFYEGKLKQGIKKPDNERNHGINIKLPYEVIAQNKHTVWIDTTYDEFGEFNKEDDSGKSRSNKLEVDVIEKMLEKLNEKYLELGYGNSRRKEVGVIAFYGAQVGLLKKTIGGYKKIMDRFQALKVEINTVDKYQGKEKDIIIVSMTRNKKINPKYKKVGSKTSFVAQFERINVAFSRAKELLIIVGAKEMFEDYEVKLPKMDKEGYILKYVYKDIINQIKEYNGFYTIKELKGLHYDDKKS